MSVLVVVNNFIHDFAAAIWLGSFLLLLFFYLESQKLPAGSKDENVQQFLARVAGRFSWLIIISIVIIFLSGVGRTLTYPAGLGRTRIIALIGKHIFLLSLAALTLWWRARIIRHFKEET